MDLASILSAGAPPSRTGAVIPDGTVPAAPVAPAPIPLPSPSSGVAPSFFDAVPVAPAAAPAPVSAPESTPSGPSGLRRFADVMAQLAPVLGSLVISKKAGAPAAGAFLKGYLDHRQEKEDELKKQALVDQASREKLMALQDAKRKELEAFMRNTMAQASGIAEPERFAGFAKYADTVASALYGLPEGFMSSQLQGVGPKVDKSDVTEAKDLIKSIGPDNLQKGLDAGAVVMFRGQQKPLKDVYALAGMPVDQTGAAVFGKKPDTNGVSEGDFIQSAVDDAQAAAKAAGKTLSGAELKKIKLDARREWTQSGHVESPSGGLLGNTSANSDTDAIAEAIMRGEQPPTMTGLYGKTAAVRGALARKGYDLTRAQQDFQATTRYLNTLNGPQQVRLRQAAQTAYDSLDVIEELSGRLSKAMPRGRFPILNRAALAAAKSGVMGSEAQTIATQLEAQISDVTSELANVYMGGNSPTDHAMSLAAKNLAGQWTEKQLADAIALARKNLQIRLNSIGLASPMGARAENPYAPQTGDNQPAANAGRGAGAGPSGTTDPNARVKVKLANGQTGTMLASEPLPPGAEIIK